MLKIRNVLKEVMVEADGYMVILSLQDEGGLNVCQCVSNLTLDRDGSSIIFMLLYSACMSRDYEVLRDADECLLSAVTNGKRSRIKIPLRTQRAIIVAVDSRKKRTAMYTNRLSDKEVWDIVLPYMENEIRNDMVSSKFSRYLKKMTGVFTEKFGEDELSEAVSCVAPEKEKRSEAAGTHMPEEIAEKLAELQKIMNERGILDENTVKRLGKTEAAKQQAGKSAAAKPGLQKGLRTPEDIRNFKVGLFIRGAACITCESQREYAALRNRLIAMHLFPDRTVNPAGYKDVCRFVESNGKRAVHSEAYFSRTNADLIIAGRDFLKATEPILKNERE
jgi:hypothetical protein